MESSQRFAGRIYGRVVNGSDGRTWLQYWFWLYYNPKNLFGFGKHEGDWEMVQVGLGADGTPELLSYAQLKRGDARKWSSSDVSFATRRSGYDRLSTWRRDPTRPTSSRAPIRC